MRSILLRFDTANGCSREHADKCVDVDAIRGTKLVGAIGRNDDREYVNAVEVRFFGGFGLNRIGNLLERTMTRAASTGPWGAYWIHDGAYRTCTTASSSSIKNSHRLISKSAQPTRPVRDMLAQGAEQAGRLCVDCWLPCAARSILGPSLEFKGAT